MPAQSPHSRGCQRRTARKAITRRSYSSLNDLPASFILCVRGMAVSIALGSHYNRYPNYCEQMVAVGLAERTSFSAKCCKQVGWKPSPKLLAWMKKDGLVA